MKIPRLLQVVLIFVGIYVAFKVVFGFVLGQPIPSSLLTMYMFFAVAGLFMVFTFTDESTRELVAPIKALVEDPARKPVRNVVFIVVPLLAGAYAFSVMLPDFDAPLELRSIHP
ncbi:MAG: hypothetical protein IH907_07970, partial [Proteobacteria bacterium]|nr:hypothetical protein [Pseudomonadota bacterium]